MLPQLIYVFKRSIERKLEVEKIRILRKKYQGHTMEYRGHGQKNKVIYTCRKEQYHFQCGIKK